jgi:hypothetical protein
LIQKTWHLDSIVARALLVTDFIDSIDPKRTSLGDEFEVFLHSAMITTQLRPGACRVGVSEPR